jgi:D-lactate dehydrogenase
MAPKKILFFDSKLYDEKTFKQALKVLNGQQKLRFTFLESKLSDETVDEAEGYDAICVFVNDVVNANVIEQLHNKYDTVKIIALRSAGFNNVDLLTAEKYGIKVCRVPRYSPYAVAEHSVALLLSLNRNLHHAFYRTKQHNFTLDGLVGVDLFGKTVGIIGTGGIGMCAINIFLGFGCKVLAHDIIPNEEVAKTKGFTYVTKDELLRQSDIVSLYAPLLDSTYHLINKDSLEKMKPTALLVNTSRGGLVDTKALVDCLKAGKIRGAALDVYENEKEFFFNDFSQQVMHDDTLARLISMPNTIVTSHQAFLTEEALKAIAETTVQSLLDFFDGKPLSENNEVKTARKT